MVRNLAVAAMLAATLANASAGTVAIGTASARGDMRVDQYKVNGNATLFDGSVVETDQATADLRLDKGVDITMSTGSRATLYHDHIVPVSYTHLDVYKRQNPGIPAAVVECLRCPSSPSAKTLEAIARTPRLPCENQRCSVYALSLIHISSPEIESAGRGSTVCCR